MALCVYEWGVNTLLDYQATLVKEWGQEVLEAKSFEREDYLELVQLILVYLGVQLKEFMFG